jgi:transcriptional regulator GlxA family with amidase domain
MNGVVLEAQATLADAAAADAVIVGSGLQTRDVVADAALMAKLQLDPARQLLGAQCSGTLVLAKLGLLDGVPACTDLTTKPWVEEAGVAVLNQPFVARGNVATAGGCLASQYLAIWLIARLEGVDAARSAMHYVAPVGEKDDYVERALRNVTPFL